MIFDGKQCPVQVLDKANGCQVAKVRLNGRWYKFWYSRPIEGNIKRVTIKKDVGGDWYLTFTTDDEGLDPETKTGVAAGFDFGLKTFLTCSDGTKYQSPEFYKKTINALKKAYRAFSRKVKSSHNRWKAWKHLARHYKKISNQRADFVIVSNAKTEKWIICIETQKGTGKDPEYIEQQLRGAECFIGYCKCMSKSFWQSAEFLDGYQYRYVSIVNINIDKQSTCFYKPRNRSAGQLHDSPATFQEIFGHQILYFDELI